MTGPRAWMAHAGELSRALRNVPVKAVSLGLERLSRFVVVVASAPVLGQASFGRFVFASTVTALLALGTDLGLGVWTTRELARRPTPRDGAPAGEPAMAIVRVGLELRALAAAPYAVAVAVAAVCAGRGEARTAMILLGVAALVNAFIDHFGATLRGCERFFDEARLNVSRAVLTAAAGLVTLTVGRSLLAFCAGLAAASLGSLAFGVVILRRLGSDHDGLRSRVRAPFDRALAGLALRQSLPLWLAGIFSMLYFKIDTLFVRSLAGDAELGAYGAAFKFFEGAMILPAVVMSVTFPRLSRAHDDPRAQRRLEWQLGALLLALGVLVGAACLVGGSPLVRLAYGRDFGRAVASLRVLALGLPLLFLNFGLTHFLVARDMGRATQRFAALMLLLNVSLDLALIPRDGGPGAAWATVVTELGLTMCCLWALKATLGSPRMPPPSRAAARRDRRAA